MRREGSPERERISRPGRGGSRFDACAVAGRSRVAAVRAVTGTRSMSVQPDVFEQQGASVRLVAPYPNARARARQLTNVMTLLGRNDGCDIVLSSPTVAEAHAALVRLGHSAYICDLGGSTGTAVNGRRVRQARLYDGDELSLGRFRFRVELDEANAAA